MPSTLTFSGPTFTNKVATALPSIPSLQTLCFFGTGGDGINTNRASGPALSIMSGAPVYSPSYVSLGSQAAGARYDVLETNNPRTSTVLASGWTYAAVGRAMGTGSSSCVIISEQNNTNQNLSAQLLMRSTTANNIQLYMNGTRINFTTTVPTSTWHFIALSYSGGALGTWTLYSFTENQSTGNPLTYVQGTSMTTLASGPHIGGNGNIAAEGAVLSNSADVAFAMVSFAVLTGTALSTLAASVRTSLARRGITI